MTQFFFPFLGLATKMKISLLFLDRQVHQYNLLLWKGSELFFLMKVIKFHLKMQGFRERE